MPVGVVVIGEIAWLGFADGAEHDDPVEQLAADIASLPHLLGCRLRHELIDLGVLDAAVDVLGPGDVGVPWRSPGSTRGPAISREKWPVASTATRMAQGRL